MMINRVSQVLLGNQRVGILSPFISRLLKWHDYLLIIAKHQQL